MYIRFFKYLSHHWMIALLAMLVSTGEVLAQIECPSSALTRPKGNTLYLYFPTTSDGTFPDYSSYGFDTSPADPFDVAELDSGIGTTAELRTRIFEMVTDDYCEFNVDVQTTTSAPTTTEPQWQIVAIGSDSDGAYGEAQDVDTDNTDAQDYGRVWAGTFGDDCAGTGGALSGTDSTLQRWANAISETTAHEAGHNYGLSHGNSAPVTSSVEDAQNNHVLATGSTGLTCATRAEPDRHFSDTSYGILGHNVGLNIKTLHNWDFVNPNDTDAHSLKLIILSDATSLSIDWWYNGSSSPWSDPTITNTGATQSFQGNTYNVYDLDFVTDKSWSDGDDGVAPPGVEFHVGATFAEDADILVFETQLFDSGGTQLDLHPRLIAYDAGVTATDTGDFAVNFVNPSPVDGPLILRDVVIRLLPRMLDIESMLADAEPQSRYGVPVEAIAVRRIRELTVQDKVSVKIANLTDQRTIDILYGPADCPQKYKNIRQESSHETVGNGPADIARGELKYCLEGNALSLFPSTYVYITATVVDPNAKYWDTTQEQFVTGPLESRVFYQLAGFKPDFNNNGTDDLIDIRTGRSNDSNENGVPDEAETKPGQPATACPCDLKPIERLLIIGLILLALLVVVIFMHFLARRR